MKEAICLAMLDPEVKTTSDRIDWPGHNSSKSSGQRTFTKEARMNHSPNKSKRTAPGALSASDDRNSVDETLPMSPSTGLVAFAGDCSRLLCPSRP